MTEEKTQENKPMNLYQKLVEIRKTVEYIKKEATGHRFKYATEGQLLAAIRPTMDDLSVVLEMDMLEPKWQTLPDGRNIAIIGFEFTWVNADNPEEKIVKHIYMQDEAATPQKIGGLCTYSHRYFLYKALSVATDDLDIDAFQQKTMSTSTITKPRISEDQISELEIKINGNDELRKKILQFIPGHKIENLTIDRFPSVLSWIEKTQKEKIA